MRTHAFNMGYLDTAFGTRSDEAGGPSTRKPSPLRMLLTPRLEEGNLHALAFGCTAQQGGVR